MELDLENPLPCSTDDDSFFSLFLLETDHMPTHRNSNAKHLGVSVRRQAIASISQLCCSFSDPLLSYLAINYLDRFLATQSMQLPPKAPWVVELIAVSCVSLATKMRRTSTAAESSLCDYDQHLFKEGDGEELVAVFDKRTIDRMEYIVLGALKWRMRSITPLSFLSFFTPLFKLHDHASRDVLKTRAIEIIRRAQMDIQVVEFKPSVVAASALMSASSELFPQHLPCFQEFISDSWSVADKEKFWKCYGLVQELAGYDESVVWRSSYSNTPVNVLDTQFSCSESENTQEDAINPESDDEKKKKSQR